MLPLRADRIRKRAWGSALAGLHATLRSIYAPGALRLADSDKFGAEPVLVDYSAAHFNLLAAALVATCTFVAVDSAYAVELASAKTVYARGKDTFVEVNVTLTGSASEVAEGRSLALVPVDRLAPGAYEAELVSTRDTWLGGEMPSWTVRRKVELRVLP